MKVIIYCLVLFSSLALAEDWTASDGKTYQDVKVLSSDATSVTILDKDGGAQVPLANLPPDIQKRFNYVPLASTGSSVSAQNTTSQVSGDTTPIKERPEWQQRLRELSSNLETIKKQGGSFVTIKNTTYAWSDITGVTPGELSYMSDKGAGTAPISLLTEETIKVLTLTPVEISKWNGEEAQRDQIVDAIALDIQKQNAAKKKAAWDALIAEREKDREYWRQKNADDKVLRQQWQILYDKYLAAADAARKVDDTMGELKAKEQYMDVEAAIIVLRSQLDEANKRASEANGAMRDFQNSHPDFHVPVRAGDF